MSRFDPPKKDEKMPKKDKIFLIIVGIVALTFLIIALIAGNINEDDGEIQAPGPRNEVTQEFYTT